MHSVRIDNPRQAFFNIGIAAAFLARLTMATGDAQWNALGGRYLEFAYRVSDGMYETAQVGKVGWGAALAYGVGGDERHLQLAERVGEAMVAQQDASGVVQTRRLVRTIRIESPRICGAARRMFGGWGSLTI